MSSANARRHERAQRANAVTASDARPLIAHVVYRFDVGGLENGVVNLHQPPAARPLPACVVALTDVTDFRQRVRAATSSSSRCARRPGTASSCYPRARSAVPRAAAGDRAHAQPRGARGRPCRPGSPACRCASTASTGATSAISTAPTARYRCVRRAVPAVRHPLRRAVARPRALSGRCASACRASRVAQDLQRRRHRRVHAAAAGARARGDCPFSDPGHLARAAPSAACSRSRTRLTARARVRARAAGIAALRARLRLVIVGDGPLRGEDRRDPRRAGVARPGVAARRAHRRRRRAARLDCFVLPSLAEGSRTRSSRRWRPGCRSSRPRRRQCGAGRDGRDGTLVPAGDRGAGARRSARYADRAGARARLTGCAGASTHRAALHGLDAMVGHYARSTNGCSPSRAARPAIAQPRRRRGCTTGSD